MAGGSLPRKREPFIAGWTDVTRRALIIAFFFPPDGGGGSQRWAKFCKRLPALGWQPTVLTRAQPASRTQWDPEDETLLEDVAAARIHRLEPAPAAAEVNLKLSGDVDPAWLRQTLAEAGRLCAEETFDVIVLTAPPYDLARLAPVLAEQIRIPVVLDLRDPWAFDGGRLFSSAAAWRRERDVMIRALERCEGVIFNTPEARAAIERGIGARARRAVVIPNGYDVDDFTGLEPAPRSDDAFRIAHLGTLHSRALYERRGPAGFVRRIRRHRPQRVAPAGRTLRPLLKAIHALRREGDPLGERVRVRVLGPVDEATERCVRDSPTPDAVELIGYLPHAEALREAASADALFLPLYGLPAGERARIVPGKTYEYLALGRPILACVPPGDARELVERTGRAACADPCDPHGIAQAIRRLQTMEAPPPGWPPEWISRFERGALTRELSEFLTMVASGSQARERSERLGAA